MKAVGSRRRFKSRISPPSTRITTCVDLDPFGTQRRQQRKARKDAKQHHDQPDPEASFGPRRKRALAIAMTVLLRFAPILGQEDARIAVSTASVGQ